MNKAIKVEEGQLIIAKDVIKKIKDLEAKAKLIAEKEKEFKNNIKEIMEEKGILGYESPDKTLKITRIPKTTSTGFNSDSFKKDYPDLYKKYYNKETQKSGSIRITVREEKKDV